MNFIPKLPPAATTIFTEMNRVAAQHGAVNLGQGFPDFDMDRELISLVNDAMTRGFNQYAHMNGYQPLREKLAAKFARLYGASVDPESDITVTPGGTYAIFTALTAILRPGDEVIIFEPAYDSYIPNIEINGAKAIPVPMRPPDYAIPWDLVRTRITNRTRALIINSPHNPTGSVLGPDDIRALQDLAAKTDILIISDEVYEHLIYDHLPHLSMLKYPDLLERSFICFSFGKTYSCTGWKLGYCVSPPALMREFRKVHQFNCFTCDAPKQVALAAYLANENAYLSLAPAMQKKRDFFRALMKRTPLKCIPSHGSYFECYEYGHFSKESDRDFALRLTRDFGVTAIPVSAFFHDARDDRVVRFCFAKKEATLEKAAEKLAGLH